MTKDLASAIQNIEKLIEELINNPPEGFDMDRINGIVRDYNIVRTAVAAKMVDRDPLDPIGK
ncbi:MAG: hypothetical protein ACXABY_15260 [Candidatus Thorarchaeota archaeon]|jgi:hypothetical protein